MKKLMPVFLCLLLACGLLAGCGSGGSAKIPPENFPHSETLRLDATVKEVVDAEKLTSLGEELYVNPTTVKIDGIEMTVNYLAIMPVDKMSATYSPSDKSIDIDNGYDQLVRYFSALYGESTDSANYFPDSKWTTTVQGCAWEYSITEDENFLICVIQQQYSGRDDAELVVIASPSEILSY